MLSGIGSALAAVLALAIILMGARYLLDPASAAAGFGIPGPPAGPSWLAVKGTRDIAVALGMTVLLITGATKPLGCLMLATSLIPIADGAIVLRAEGPKAVAYGVHWTTAAAMTATPVRPPSTSTTVPLTKRDSSEAR